MSSLVEQIYKALKHNAAVSENHNHIRVNSCWCLNQVLEDLHAALSDSEGAVRMWPSGHSAETAVTLSKEAWDVLILLVSTSLPVTFEPDLVVKHKSLDTFSGSLRDLLRLFFPSPPPEIGDHVDFQANVSNGYLTVTLVPVTDFGKALVEEVEQRVIAKQLTS